MLIPYDLFHAGDNPMQAEECSHRGLKCNYFCHTCKVGVTMVNKKTDEGYTSIFKVGINHFHWANTNSHVFSVASYGLEMRHW